MSKTTDITFCAADFRIAMYLCRPALPRIAITPPHLALTEYNGRAALLAQSLEIEITAPIGNAQPRPAATLCAEAFKGLFASKIGAEDVTIKLPADPAANIEVQLDDCIASFVPAYAEGLPEPTTANGQPHTIRIERKTLANALRLTAWCMSTEETRYYLNGISIHPHPTDPTAVIFCATDGHRLVKHVVEGLNHTLEHHIIIPSAAVKTLRGMLSITRSRDDIDITITPNNRALFTCGDFQLATKLIDGTFPDFERVIPQNAPIAATIFAAPLRLFCARIARFPKNCTPGVSLVLDAKKSTLRAEWKPTEIGDITARIDANVEASFSIGFQYRYLINMLDVIRTENITIHATDSASPTIFASAGELADPSTTIILMPMRV